MQVIWRPFFHFITPVDGSYKTSAAISAFVGVCIFHPLKLKCAFVVILNMMRYSWPDRTAARPVGIDSIVNSAESFAVYFRLEVGTSAVILFWQIVYRTATALPTSAALSTTNPHQAFPAVTVKLVTVTVCPIAILVLLRTRSVMLPWT